MLLHEWGNHPGGFLNIYYSCRGCNQRTKIAGHLLSICSSGRRNIYIIYKSKNQEKTSRSLDQVDKINIIRRCE
ncbi:hypothetical protein PV327_005923 [Microctonus hyperodae]|uniref:Uncharacterized protein n=1 Tax=Microctonus hyperodae TaxID=165561 RepID=A0AA39G374_MICHY|nr:hypothetical protein PV327_005923 [Microctonus hyperodae]